MTRSHNKKRNIGIVYEQLLRYISIGIVENDASKVRKASQIIKAHFKPGTEIYREFKLFNALVKTQASSDIVAKTIIREARSAAKKTNPKNLDIEKSRLIKSINYTLNESGFYHQRIPEYRTYATIQTLLNDWRAGSEADITRLAEFEHKVQDWLLKEKKETDLSELKEIKSDKLVAKLMLEKINNSYGAKLSDEQKEIVRSYTLMAHNKDRATLQEYLSGIKDRVLTELSAYLENEESKVLQEKADAVIRDIKSVPLDDINESTIIKFLTISQLKSELEEDNG